RKVGHVFHRQNARDDALVAVAARHLVALGDLAALRDHHAHHLVDTRGQLVVVLPRIFLHIDDRAPRAVRHAQARVLPIPRLPTEDCAQQALFRREVGFATLRHLADENVVRAYLRADADDAALIQIGEAVFTDVRDIARDFLRAELRVPRLALVLLDVDGRE